ncbi:MAG: site-specific integrase [Chlorobium sp.]|nr:site-specific integrase [Chlorobium sp.]
MIRAFSFLRRDPQSGLLSFRLRVPGHLQKLIGRTEIKRSLRTADKRLAIPVAMGLYIEVQKLFEQLEKGEPMRKPKRQKEPESGFIPKITFDEIEMPGGKKAKGVVIDTGNHSEDLRLAKELLGGIGGTTKQKNVAAVDSAKLAMVAKKYQAEKVAEKSWTPKTAVEYEALYELLVQVIGNVEIATITHKDAREFKDCLLKLPPNMSKGIYAGKTVKQILAMNPKTRMSVGTINDKLQRVSSLFLWAVRHGYATLNPFDGLKLKENRRAQDKREKLDTEDLQKIFDPRRFNMDQLRQPFKYWVPLLALYTGGRAKELAKLYVKDVIIQDDIPAINITEEVASVKSLSSVRTVPLHPKIIELGFLHYVDSIRKAGHEQLFPEAWDTENGPGDKVSRWFAVYRKGLKIGRLKKEDGLPAKCFHSFRHSFADGLKQAGADGLKIKQLMGHADKDISTGLYGKSFPLSTIYEAVCLLNFKIFTC